MNDKYYAVERTSDSLQHYGVQGMKWGVRKAVLKGNEKALKRQFIKASKKLNKLENRGANGKKYAKRAAKLGVAGGILGAAGVLGSTENIDKLQNAIARKNAVGVKGFKSASKSKASSREVTKNLKKWASGPSTIQGVTRHGVIRVGSAAVGAGLLAAAGHNAYRAATAGRNRKKAATFRKEMQTAFKGTKYANQIPSAPAEQQKSKKRRKSAKA